nr:MscL family protein [bacterium]
VKDLLMPPLGLVLGHIDLSQKYIQLDGDGQQFETLDAARTAGANVIAYGSFINAIIQFVLLALAVFILVRFINNLQKPEMTEEVLDTRMCPFCTLAISDQATRCPNCTSEVEATATG